MIDPFLTEALSRLDAWLAQVCEREEARAKRLAPEGALGWAAVRAMTGPAAAELLFDGNPPPDLLPDGDHSLGRVRDALGLSPAEAEALLVLLSLHLEPRYRALYAVLQDDLHQAWITERLLLTVLGRTPDRHFALLEALSTSGQLLGAGFVQSPMETPAPLGRALDLAPEVRGALLGFTLPSSLGGVPFERIALASPDALPAVAIDPFVVIHGAGPFRAEAERLADEMLLLGPSEDRAALSTAALAAWRLGLLHGAVVAVDLTGLDAGADAAVAAALHRRVLLHGGRVVVRARAPLPLSAPQREARLPAYGERVAAWRAVADARDAALDDGAIHRLAATFRFGPEGVREAFAAVAEPTEPALREAAARLLRTPVRHAVEVAVTRSFADLVVRDTTRASLERLVHYAESRDRLAEAQGLDARFRLRRGPLVLFAGRSGTGKTLAAEVVAEKLGRPLYVVDLSRLVSKYIGETEKHIEEVFTEAERAGVVLFFDEADALFSTRTEVTTSNDRYANLEVGFLLQRVERHDGLVILATNLRHSIDEAFLRRFQFRIEFPFPEPEERRGIWERMIPPGVPRDGELDLDALARTHRLAGGDISNAALKAIFLAEQEGARLSRPHLDRAVAMELHELGRLSRRELPREGDGDRGLVLRCFVEALEALLEEHLRQRFTKEIHIVHGAPTKEALAGRRPAISVALYRMVAPRTGGLRIGLIVSTWSHRAEEEHELLGAAHEALAGRAIGKVAGRDATMRLQESYDFDLLYRFWSSHGHPVRASLVVEGEVG